MENWAEIRRRVHVDGQSKRLVCRDFDIHWDTLQKILHHSEPPGYRRAVARPKPKLEPFLPVIHQILEADKKAPRKQRHTAHRIFERLRDEHGYQGGLTIVKAEVASWRLPTPGSSGVGTARSPTRSSGLRVITCSSLISAWSGGPTRRATSRPSSGSLAGNSSCRRREQVTYDPVRYLAVLERKPGALDFAAPLAGWELPVCFGVLRRQLEAEFAGAGTRQYIKVLRLLEKSEPRELARAVGRALELGVADADAVRLILEHRREQPAGLFCLDGRPHLRSVVVPSPDLSAYASLAAGVTP